MAKPLLAWIVMCVAFCLWLAQGGAEPETQPVLPASVPSTRSTSTVVKDGLSVTLAMAKETFGVNEPIAFDLRFTNVSKKGFLLNDPGDYWHWSVCFKDLRHGGPWRLNPLFNAERDIQPVVVCRPGDTFDVGVYLDPAGSPPFHFVWAAETPKPISDSGKRLPPGHYQLSIQMLVQNDPAGAKNEFPFWTGPIEIGPVEFRISDKAATDEPLVITNGYAGRIIKAVIGQTVAVSLRGDSPNTRWEAGQSKGASVKQEIPALEFAPAKGATDQAIGAYTFRYKAVAEGRTTLSFSYVTTGKPAQGQDLAVTIDVAEPTDAKAGPK